MRLSTLFVALSALLGAVQSTTTALSQCEVSSFGAPVLQAGGWFGIAVAATDDWVAVSEPKHIVELVGRSGAVHMYAVTESGLVYHSELPRPSPAFGDRFGSALDMDGEVLVVGAKDRRDSGTAFVYRYNGVEWEYEQEIIPPPYFNGHFGDDVAICGDRLAMSGFSAGPTGVVATYRYDGSSWTDEQVLIPSALSPGDYFGRALDLDGEWLAVSASHYDTPQDEGAGSVFVYNDDGSDWVFHTQILAATDVNHLGEEIALSDGRMLVRATDDVDTGYVLSFVWSGLEWEEVQLIQASDAAPSAEFGNAISIRGDRAVIGSKRSDDACDPPATHCNSGAVYYYTFEGAAWSEQAKFVALDAESEDFFGDAVAVSSFFGVFGAYAVENSCPEDCNSGRAYVFGLESDCPFFVRGDCNADGGVNIGDAIHSLNVLFGAGTMNCSDACDGNDSGQVDLADPIHTLDFLFSSGPAPMSPFAACWIDPTSDVLGCVSSACP